MKIEINNVSKKMKKDYILKNIDLTLNSGVITGFSGINGSGKTMLMRMIAGLIKPSEGTIIIGDKQLWKDISFPQSIGILIENPAFLDSYSGLENLWMIASINKRIDKNQVREVISSVGLNPDDKKKYKKYSLGMKQRLGIAAALMEKPEIILLDEPTNALDSSGIEMLKKLIINERSRGALIVISCHDANILKELSDEVYYLKEGSISDYQKIKKEDGIK